MTSAETKKWAIINEYISDYVLELDLQGHILDINRVLPSLKKSDVIGMNCMDYIPKEQHSIFKDALKKVKSTGKMQSYEFYTHIEKKEEWWFNRMVPIKVDDAIERVIVIATDISHLKKAESAKNESEFMFKTVIENAPLMINFIDKDGQFTFLNEQHQKYLGYSCDEVMACDNALKLFYPDPKYYAKVLKIILKTDGKFREYNVTTKDGTTRFQLWANFRMPDKSVISFGYDITDRKLSEMALLESEERFRTMFSTASVGILTNTPDGSLLQVNKAFCDFIGYSDEELYKLNIVDITHKEDQKITSRILKEFKTGKRDSLDLEKRYVRKDGKTVWGHVTASWHNDADGKKLYVITFIHDITLRKEHESRQLKQLKRNQAYQDALLKIITSDSIIAGDFKKAVKLIIKEAALAMNLERVSIWMLNDNDRELTCINLYENSKNKYSNGTVLKSSEYPKYFKALCSGRMVDADVAVEDNRTNEFANGYLKPLNIGSMLDSAIRIAGKVVGVVCHEHVGQPISWSEDEKVFACEIADHVAQVILNEQRIEAVAQLKIAHADLEVRVAERTKELNQKNLALKEVLEQIEIDKKKIKEDVVSNIQELIVPSMQKLKRRGTPSDRKHIEIVEKNLEQITTGFGVKISTKQLNLSPREIEICDMIKNGLSSKDISGILNVSYRTVELHRTNIRKKLGINKQDVNLATYLQSLS